MTDNSELLQKTVVDAYYEQRRLKIVGGNTKAFYGRKTDDQVLNTAEHTGVINYEATELVITARTGTLLSEIEATLHKHDQMLPFEPPHFGQTATLGGTIACNLSGPRRPYAGSARDFILGTKVLNGRGEILRFGGEVMKNVAGYDVSRLMCGAMGTLGLLLEVSIKVLPRAEDECTLVKELDESSAINNIAHYSRKALPISASLYDGNRLYIRLCGTAQSVVGAKHKIGGELLMKGENFWNKINEHKHPFFDSRMPLWRLSLAPNSRPIKLEGKFLLDWGGAQRWLLSHEPAEKIRSMVEKAGGHASLFRNNTAETEVFHPLPAKLMQLHQNLKKAFDPAGILNSGRLYADF